MTNIARREVLAGIAAAAVARPAFAQGFPQRAVTIVVPYAPGGSTDVLARLFARGMSRSLGQPVVVENVAGAGGSVGTLRVVRAAPDGHTLTFGNTGPLAANLWLYPNLGYDPRRDLAPVGMGAMNPMVLAVSNRSGLGSLADLIARLRAEPGKVNFGNAGSGSTTHLAAAQFLRMTNTTATAVGYRGAGPAMTDLAAGVIDALIDQTLTMIPGHRGGTVKAVAVATPRRLPQLPDVPTFIEGGLPQFDMAVWNAMLAPAGTPQPVMERLTEALSAAIDDPEAQQRLVDLAAVVPGPAERGPAPLRAFMAAEADRWREVIREARITVD
jgi:tripartite-type tricarboxylate transporter receptor subunit TctC